MAKILRSVTAPLGFTAAGGTFGIKVSGRPDMALIAASHPCQVAAVFTTNQIPSEPVRVGRRHVAGGRCRAIVCNSGNANASTGRQGMADARSMCAAVARQLHCKTTEVLACSTGVIGRPLPMDKILPGIDVLASSLAEGPHADAAAAEGIMTTDLRPKHALRKVKLSGKTVTLGGIAKGSGMIAPNMATMLGFLTTDADLSLPLLRSALRDAVNADASFNRTSVDTDTSPSDTVVLLASGLAGHAPIRKRDADYARFVEALTALCRDLAYQIVADGEGVEHVLRVRVRGARSEPDALRVARAVADSPLVKTAVHGGDPNWGRLTMAAGKSGAQVRADKLIVKIGAMTVYRFGTPAKVDLKKLQALMKKPEVLLSFDLGLGRGSCEFLGCDLSRDYIRINADYTT